MGEVMMTVRITFTTGTVTVFENVRYTSVYPQTGEYGTAPIIRLEFTDTAIQVRTFELSKVQNIQSLSV